ncbi:hypothetical protein T492DRAFT_1065001 [Pavlovales sp. CCMP2436]|nr:hypothetical protein T492DRAFT_1065001 [Pavlovales sp. CCMP2436]
MGASRLAVLVLSSVAVSARRMAPPLSKAALPSKAGLASKAAASVQGDRADKICVVCNRPFNWRKKWERCWDEVSTCSKRCNGERRSLNQQERKLTSATEGGGDEEEPPRSSRGAARGAADSPPSSVTEGRIGDDDNGGVLDARAERKAAKKEVKATRKAIREGTDATAGQKQCDLCSKSVDLLIRCQIDPSGTWRMVCGACWRLPSVASGVIDGDGSNAFYRYGGLWKNLKKAA